VLQLSLNEVGQRIDYVLAYVLVGLGASSLHASFKLTTK